MSLEDITDVHHIESLSFPIPWPAYAFRQELETNRLARYLVVRAEGRVVAYGGIWLMVDEAHVTTFAVLPTWRRRGIGGRLMLELLRLAVSVGASVATLEVRLSNLAARTLYQRFGFRPVGVRPRYYSDNGEDALIMTTESLASPAMQGLLDRLAERFGTGQAVAWPHDEEAVDAHGVEATLGGEEAELDPGDAGDAPGWPA